MLELTEWKRRNNVSDQAFSELITLFNINLGVSEGVKKTSESVIQQHIRLEAPAKGVITWRNNVGAATTDTGSFVRFGLANDTAAMNKRVKSHDLIGIKKLLIKPEHVGTIIGQFWSREVKESGWNYTGKGREPAQLNFGKIVIAHGGDAKFATSINDI